MKLELYQLETEDDMKKAIDLYTKNIAKISTGRANPQLVSSIMVDYYETLTPLSQLSVISVPEPRQLLIKPFDQSITSKIVSTINTSSIGLHAADEGDKARITLPEMTTERRKELVKMFSKYTEQAKISVRNARQNVNKSIKSDEELSEDESHNYLEEIQNLTDKYISKIDEITKNKELDLMSI